MELIEQHHFPQPFQLTVRIPRAGEAVCGRQPELRFPEGELALAVALLGLRLRGVRAPVGREVQLSDVRKLGTALALHVLEELHGMAHLGAGRTLQVLQPPGILHVIPGRTASPIPEAKGKQEHRNIFLLIAVLFPALNEHLRIDVGVVPLEHVGKDLRTIDPFPHKDVVREGVTIIVETQQFLGSKILDSAAGHDLREGRGKPKAVRKPHQPALYPELLFVKPPAVHQLADQAFTGRHVRVRFHPHAALHHDLARLNLIHEPGIELGIVLLQHCKQGRLAHEKPVIGIFVQQSQLRRKRAGTLARCFHLRPQPRQIQMRLAENVH